MLTCSPREHTSLLDVLECCLPRLVTLKDVIARADRSANPSRTRSKMMYDRQTWSRLARLKARKIYREMQVEGLNQNDLSRKLREVAEREEAAVRRFVDEYGVDAIDARLLLQLALGDEATAQAGCLELARGRSIQQAIAVITMVSGEEYIFGRFPGKHWV
jgi:hypothetical protein